MSRAHEPAEDVVVWWRGLEAGAGMAEADALLLAFLARHDPVGALIAPVAAPLADTVNGSVGETLWGWMATGTAECRWRVEGEQVALAIVSEADLADLADGSARWRRTARADVALDPTARAVVGAVRVCQHTYTRSDAAALSRLEVIP